MNTRQETTLRYLRHFGGDTALFFLSVYLYVWLLIDPRLVYHGIGILSDYHPFSFHTGWAFFEEHLARPGGLAEYAARFLSQFYTLGWAGALIVTAAALLCCRSADALGRMAGRPSGRVLRYVPAVLLMILYGSYSHPLGAVLSLLTALSGFLLYVRWAPQGLWKRLTTLVIACAMVYQVAGAGVSLFAIMVAIYESFLGRRAAAGGVALACGLAAPWIMGSLVSLDLKEAYAGFLVSDPGTLPGKWPFTLALGLFFPGLLVGSLLAPRRTAFPGRSGRPGKAVLHSDSPDSSLAAQTSEVLETSEVLGCGSAALCGFLRNPLYRRTALTALVLLGAGAAAWFSLDTLARTVLEIDYHSHREQWADALAAAGKLPPGTYNVRCNRNVALALYHTGRLGDELFRYPQRPGVDLFSTPGKERDLGTYYQESRLLFELGQVNEAEKSACEALETRGDLPAVLEELAWINVVKGRPETARIFLCALALHPLHRQAARKILDRLEADPAMDDDPRVSRLRRNMVAEDYVALETTIEDLLQGLLDTNPKNRMAFEFLMAHHLLVSRLDRAVAGLARLRDFSYAEVPRHYQEAAAIYAQVTGKRPVTAGYPLDAAVLAQAGQFAGILAGARSRRSAAQAALEAGFGDSYFFYFTFGTSGL